MDVSSIRPWFGRLGRALLRLEPATKLAMVCMIFAWFFMNTLVVSLGSLQHGVRFFDMSAVIADPTRLFFGVDNGVQRALFGCLCTFCVFAPLAPELWKRKVSWLAYLAPLALLVVCGAILYSRTSGEFFAPPADPKSLTGSLARFANDMVRQGSGLVSRHVSLGAGAYLALIGSVFLAAHGIRRYRHAP